MEQLKLVIVLTLFSVCRSGQNTLYYTMNATPATLVAFGVSNVATISPSSGYITTSAPSVSTLDSSEAWLNLAIVPNNPITIVATTPISGVPLQVDAEAEYAELGLRMSYGAEFATLSGITTGSYTGLGFDACFRIDGIVFPVKMGGSQGTFAMSNGSRIKGSTITPGTLTLTSTASPNSVVAMTNYVVEINLYKTMPYFN